ncbi:hypothetical protein JCM10212_003970 [Sporobolomyces blumeae]
MSSASAPDRIDHLNGLPAELLQAICDLVQTSDKPVPTTVSRALHPFLLRGLFLDVRLSTSGQQLIQFRQTDFLEEREALPWILARLTSVDTISYGQDGRSAMSLQDFLAALPCPEKLRSLIWQPAKYYPDALVSLSATTPSLKSLTLEGSECCIDTAFAAFLSPLALREVTFGAGVDLSLEGLLSVVQGPSKHPTLRRIVLNHVTACTGTFADDLSVSEFEKFVHSAESDDGDGYDRYSRRDYRLRDDHEDDVTADELLDDWSLPDWYAAFDRGDMESFCQIAREQGFEVSGTALDAADVEDLWEEECAILEGRMEELRYGTYWYT